MGTPSRSLVICGLALSAFACSAEPDVETGSEASGATASGKVVTLIYLGSSQFLRSCAGDTLGCGRKVASVSDSTPYFSAPRSVAACDEFWTFRINDKCVEARHLEISDTHGFIEGNPGLFDALGLSHSDGVACAGSGTTPGVRMERGQTCGSTPPPCTDAQCKQAHPGEGFICSTSARMCIEGCHEDSDCPSGRCDKTLRSWKCVAEKEPTVGAPHGDCVDRAAGWYCAVVPEKAIHCNGTSNTADRGRLCRIGQAPCTSKGLLPTDGDEVPVCQ